MIAQGSEAWLAERAGHATASRFRDILAQIRSGEAASRRNYRVTLITERLTGTPTNGYVNAAMTWGKDQEPYARMAYEAATGALVEEVGFIRDPRMAFCGCSPDGLIGADGGIEIKCPFESSVHVETLLARHMPPEHAPQVQGCMWVTGRRWWDFISYDPRMPEHLRLFVQRIERDNAFIARLETEVADFLAEVDVYLKKLGELACTS